MRLDVLVASLPATTGLRVTGDARVEVTRVDHDSRQVEPGSLFACLPGEHHDGHDFAAVAVARGAVALLCRDPQALAVPQVVVEDPRGALGPLAARIVGDPSRTGLQVVGVTGTNAKTTVAHLTAAVARSAGMGARAMGTLTGVRTTPEAPELQRALRAAQEQGDQLVAMEVSSHALALRRVDGTRFAVAVFTNLSPEHLDFHQDMEDYYAAKARLFTPELAELGVVNVEDAWGRRLSEEASIPIVPVGLHLVEHLEVGLDRLSCTWRGQALDVPLGGRFNAENVVLAAESAVAAGIEPSAVAHALTAVPAVPGRFEVVNQGQPFVVVVDYAHTPAGLERVLATAREHTAGRLTVVFGCGGDRDQHKRPTMGAVAERLADRVVLTDDNPRGEDPDAIVADILAGMAEPAQVAVVRDRRGAIADALAGAREHDTVVIAGKGHEQAQIVGTEARPFDDRSVTRELLATAGYPGPGAVDGAANP